MATNRFGYSDDFVLKNGKVGINTTEPQEKLDVVGVVKGQDLKVTGVSSFTTYEGFLEANHTIDENITLTSGTNSSLSGEIIIGTGVTVTIANVGLGTTTVGIGTNYTGTNTIDTDEIVSSGQGGIDSLKVYNTFTVPTGGTEDRPIKVKPGQLYYNVDFKTIEFWDGNNWRQVDNTTRSGRAVLGGGYSTTTQKTMSYINISSEGNAINFGDLVTQRFRFGACSSSTRGLFGGGINPSTVSTIDYITIASEGNAIQFGSLSAGRATANSSCSSSTRGLWAGGYNPSSNVIDYVEINTLGTAQDFGDLRNLGDGANGEKNQLMSCSSPTRGVWAGGSPIAAGTILLSGIDFVTISSKGNAINGGELTQDAFQSSAFSNSVRGIFGENRISANTITTNVLSFVTLSSLGNAQDFGDLTIARFTAGSASSQIRGVIAGGYTGAILNTIDFVTISTTGNAQDFGDLTKTTYVLDGCSDSHGGLGGF